MAASKTKQPEEPIRESWFPQAFASQQRNALLLLAMLGGLGYAAFEAWKHWGASHAHWETYTLGWEEISVSPPPPWVRSDVKGDVARRVESTRLALRDQDLTRQVAQSFALHPWVAKVQRVKKAYPASLQVELAYRRPVAMVEVEHQGRAGLLPIDRDGVLLPPEDFTTGDAKALPRIRIEKAFPVGSVGSAWGDERVVGAARLAEVVAEKWSSSPLFCIAAQPLTPGGSAEATCFELLTRAERHILWGRAPGRESSGELHAAEKIEKLWEVLRRPGTEPVDLRAG